MKVTRDWVHQNLLIDQTTFVYRIFKNFKIEKYKTTNVLMNSDTKIFKNVYKKKDYKATKWEIQEYQSLVITSIYLFCITCPDILFAVRESD